MANRDKNSDPQDPRTLGKDAYVCDAWDDSVYPASELNEPRTYKFSKVEFNYTSEHTPTDIQVNPIEVLYDPEHHKLTTRKHLNTDYIREHEAYERNVDTIGDAYKQRSSRVVSTLEDFSSDLRQLQEQAYKNKNIKKSALLDEKIKSVQEEISRVKQEITTSPATTDDYIKLRNELASSLSDNVSNYS